MLRRIFIATAGLVMALTVVRPASADTWSVSGSARVAAVAACDRSPTCAAFLESGCAPALERPDGLEASIVRLPSGAAGQGVAFRWVAAHGPAPKAMLEHLGPDVEGCAVLEQSWVPGTRYPGTSDGNFGALEFGIHPNAVWVAVTADAALDLTWTLLPSGG